VVVNTVGSSAQSLAALFDEPFRRTFAKASRQIPEMEQAILLIRAVISLPKQMSSPLESAYDQSPSSAARKHSTTSAISQGLVRILISMAENPEDPFQAITLETLTELGRAWMFKSAMIRTLM
jgi:hypothetical protein